jgi:hypothetical protein
MDTGSRDKNASNRNDGVPLSIPSEAERLWITMIWIESIPNHERD